MAHKFDIGKKDKLDNSRRRAVLPPKETLLEMGIKPGHTVADIGCGIGYFTTEAAKIVGETATVYGLDISEEMLEDTRLKAISEKLGNIETVKTEEYGLRLSDESVDYAFTANVIHEVEDKDRFIGEVGRILKSGGLFGVVDFDKRETEMGPPLDHRVSAEEVESLLESAGFKVLYRRSFSNIFYGILAEKVQ